MHIPKNKYDKLLLIFFNNDKDNVAVVDDDGINVKERKTKMKCTESCLTSESIDEKKILCF